MDPPPSAGGRGRPPPRGADPLPELPSAPALGPALSLLRDGLLVLLDGRHVDAGKEVAVHVIGASDVVDVGRVGVQVDGVIGDEVSIDDRHEAQILQYGVYRAERQVLTPSCACPLVPEASVGSSRPLRSGLGSSACHSQP